jgi:hypothetical protein
MTTIYGTVGYTFLKSNNETEPIYILVLSDIHSKLKYCDNYIQIADWLKENMINVNILLEEVSREDFKLGELWSSSDHTVKLKNLYLNNSKDIHDIDIRPYLVPFSWELLNEKGYENIKFKKYVNLVNDFLYVKMDKIGEKINKIYNSKYLKNHILKYHLCLIRDEFTRFLLKNNDKLETYIYEIYNKDKSIFIDLNLILDSCMEWYIIAKIFDLKQKNKKNYIIHTGLFHSERINKILKELYNYKVILSEGLNFIDDAENNSDYDGCIFVPETISESLTDISI